MRTKLWTIFKRIPKRKQSMWSPDRVDLLERTAYLQGDSDGYLRGKQEGFDAGVVEGYNTARAEVLEEFKQAAIKALNKTNKEK